MSDYVLFCHTCSMEVRDKNPLSFHETHMLEAIREGQKPFLKMPDTRIWAVCNVWDSQTFWMYSLMSLRNQVDGFIVLSGPYTDSVPQDPLIDVKMLAVYESYVPSHMPLDWIYMGRWESHLKKRQAGFESKVLRPGDWVLVIDDDEILTVQGKLRQYLTYFPGNLMSLRAGQEDTFDRFSEDLDKNLAALMNSPIGFTNAEEMTQQFALPQLYQSVKQPQDVTFRTRLFKWMPGTNYAENHWTIRRQDGSTVVGEVKLWDVSILHARGLRPLQSKLEHLKYFATRQQTNEDKPTSDKDAYTGW